MAERRPSPFRQRDIVRAMKAARLAGFENFRVEIEPNGKLVINTAREPDREREGNPWDDEKVSA